MIRSRIFLIFVSVFAAASVFAGEDTTAAADRSCQLKLTGVAVLSTNQFALLQVEETGKAPVSVMLKQGVVSCNVELLAIDLDKKEVVVKTHGSHMKLWFDENASATAPAYGRDPAHPPIPLLPDPAAGEL